MRAFIRLSALAVVLIASPLANALALGVAELSAAKSLGCVLAEDALGYLSEEQFTERFDMVVDGFIEGKVDVIYAKALGYIDGLLFGLSSNDTADAMARLQDFSSSQACSRAVNIGVSL
ncbi:hypothetical protein N8198_06305 [Gammaproteobacteria bacterium]|nr:hypothetical protein [Gammaproteobacteria bacterium]